jgi:fatty acid desaturase
MTQQLWKVRLCLRNKASWDAPYEWLCEHNLHHHYVNIYYNEPDVIVVLKDRTSALMLKLALA